MARKRENKYSLREIVTRALELPIELSDLSKTTLLGNKEVSIQNFKGILEYETGLIRLNTRDFMVKITGQQLDIKSINDEDITVTGIISAIEFQ